MASPITWQNINGPSLAEASRPLDSAARAFDMGFGGLRSVLDQANQIDSQNWQQGKTNNTNTILDSVAGLGTVDAARAAQQENLVGKMKAGFGAQVDSNAVRGALEQRITGLMNQERQKVEFNNFMTDEKEAPLRDQYRQAALKQDKETMARIQQANPNMRDMYKMLEYGVAQERGFNQENRLGETHDRQGVMQTAQIGHMRHGERMAEGQLANARANTALSARGMKINEANAMFALEQRLEDRGAKYRAEYSNTFKNEANTLAGQAVIDDAIASIKDPNDQKQARIAAAQIQKDNPKIPTSAVISGIKGIDTDWSFDIVERSAAARAAVKAAGTSNSDAEYAKQLRETLNQKMIGLTAQQQRVDNFFSDTPQVSDKGSINVDARGTTNSPTNFGMPVPTEADVNAAVAKGRINAAVDPAPTGNFIQNLSFNQAQEARQRRSQDKTTALRNEFNAERKEQGEVRARFLDTKIKAMSKAETMTPRAKADLDQYRTEREELKKLLGK